MCNHPFCTVQWILYKSFVRDNPLLKLSSSSGVLSMCFSTPESIVLESLSSKLPQSS